MMGYHSIGCLSYYKKIDDVNAVKISNQLTLRQSRREYLG